ncbi:hypothetical protein ZIOFF_062307 [Zingiber officinale]|uniref:UspA domain-containing protein n=1 Tax=Zingiber officinale TaxID=94328 RepID=A0A8J5F583_ZINOF|nr:hypothetical protein ZIOFF_062307 [Zingiber officinale]
MGIDGKRLSCFGVKKRKKAAAPSIRLGSPRPSWAATPKPQSAPVAEGGKGRGGRRIVVAVEVEAEAKGAVQWALSHSLHDDDTLVLVAVVKPPSRSSNVDSSVFLFSHFYYRNLGDQCDHHKERNSRYQLLYALQSICHSRRPEIQVEVLVVEGREAGPAIVEAARRQMASLLVLGQRQRWRSMAWRLVAVLWSDGGGSSRVRSSGGDVVDYCIQNASCMTLSVRKKGKRGGYLITTKHHKNFWLLA